jgi:hypothetical protein
VLPPPIPHCHRHLGLRVLTCAAVLRMPEESHRHHGVGSWTAGVEVNNSEIVLGKRIGAGAFAEVGSGSPLVPDLPRAPVPCCTTQRSDTTRTGRRRPLLNTTWLANLAPAPVAPPPGVPRPVQGPNCGGEAAAEQAGLRGRPRGGGLQGRGGHDDPPASSQHRCALFPHAHTRFCTRALSCRAAPMCPGNAYTRNCA